MKNAFEAALAAFQRGVERFPLEWHAVVMCEDEAQLRLAFAEAQRILDGEVAFSETQLMLNEAGVLNFIAKGNAESLLDTLRVPHIMVLTPIDEDLRERLTTAHRSPTIEPSVHRWDEVTL